MTREIILFNTLSFLLLSIKTVIEPSLLTLPPITLSPSSLYIGKDSPVNKDSSTLVEPFIITPSKGIVSPSLIIILSPAFKNFVSTLTI